MKNFAERTRLKIKKVFTGDKETVKKIAESYQERAEQLSKEGDYSKALKLYGKAQEYCEDGTLDRELLVKQTEEVLLKQAEQVASEAVKHRKEAFDAEESVSLYRRAHTPLWAWRDIAEDAMKNFRKGADFASLAGNLYAKIGKLYLAERQLKEALEDYQHISKSYEDMLVIMNNRENGYNPVPIKRRADLNRTLLQNAEQRYSEAAQKAEQRYPELRSGRT